MNKIILKLSIFALLIMSVSCATTHPDMSDKYNFDELEEIKEISKYRVSSWERVDFQSVILRANSKDYYLLVLQRPMSGIITGDKIGISNTVTSIKAGVDKIYVRDSSKVNYYIIDKIYKLNGREHAIQVKKQIRKS